MSTLRVIKLMSWVVCSILLSQCTKATDLPLQPVHPTLISPYKKPAATYLALANNQQGVERQVLMIKAAGRLIEDGQWQDGVVILSRLPHLPEDLISEKQLLLAKVDLIRNRPQAAIAKLSALQDVAHLPLYYQAAFHERLALAYQSAGNATESIAQRMTLEQVLPDEASKANNRRALWLTLTTIPMAELNTLGIEASDGSALQGWVRLAMISRKSYKRPQAMLEAIQRWKEDYPGHSAQYILPNPLESVVPRLFSSPKHLALLLPLTGALAGPGHAIKDGFMAASEANPLAIIRVYDTTDANVRVLYQKAIEEGADYVVGPLSKADVMVVAGMNHPVPTLLLNDLEGSPKEGAYQFGMSPSNEAQQVAFKARQKGYSKALVIAPTGTWGNDIVNAFAHQWRRQGGRIVDTLSYQSNDSMNTLLRDFLRISDSEKRKKQLRKIIGHRLEATPRRRHDFDVIFLLAYPSKARQIMPLLHYYYAGDVPVYATSSVYAGSANPMKDRDLDGIIFCDMPWVFYHQAGHKNWPEPFNSYNRLYAFGMDSYALATQLNPLVLFPAMGVTDHSGVLYLKDSQKIVRMLAWGQFKQGLAQKINGDVVTF